MRIKMLRRTLILFFMTLFLFCAVPLPNAKAADDAIIAVVNNDTITLKDLREYLNAIYLQLISEGKSEEDLRQIMTDYEINGINQLIDDKLLVDEADKKEMQLKPKLIEERIAQIKKHYTSEQAFIQALSQDGLTVSDLKNKILDQLKAKYIIETEVRSKIQVNPQEVTDYFKLHRADFQSPEKMSLDSIFISYKDGRDQAQEKADQALAMLTLKQGENFPEVAKEFSDAPSIGLIERGQLLAPLEKSIFKLQEGEVSSLIETDEGIYIFKAKEKISAKVLSLEDVDHSISDRLFQEKFAEELKKWLQELRSKAYVEIKG